MFRPMGEGSRLATAASIATLALAGLACQISVGGPQPPGLPIPVSSEAAADLAQTWQDAVVAAATTGQLVIIMNESELTSYLASRLAQSENPILREPQVYLRQGVMQIYGKSVQGPFEAGVLIEVQPRVGLEGELGFAVTKADFGPLPVPEAFTDSLSSVLTEAFAGSLGSLATGLRITTLAIADGELALIGEVR